MKKDHFFLPTTCSSKFKQQSVKTCGIVCKEFGRRTPGLDWTAICFCSLSQDLLHQRYNGYGPCMEILSGDSTTVSDRLRQWARQLTLIYCSRTGDRRRLRFDGDHGNCHVCFPMWGDVASLGFAT
ncbi:hypothetical protein GBA52_005999 [Prunus armeniaca]|nr:hypothetical protein GBA52_005999 [Prunus armeniaca]